MTTCQRCLLTAGTLNLAFDGAGVCSFCRTYERHAPILNDHARMEGLLRARLSGLRGRGDHDCIVGFSGGKDSAYVAHRLIRDFGLRCLLYTWDNGFLTDFARANMRRVAARLGADHVIYTPPPELHRVIYQNTMRRFAVPCIGCTFPGMAHIFKVAVERDIPFMIHGRSRSQMFKDLLPGSLDVFLRFLWGNFRPYDPAANRRFMIATAHKLIRFAHKLVPDRRFRALLAEQFTPDLARLARAETAPEMLGLFLFEAYDEARMKAVLERELGWQRPPDDDLLGHEDCQIHDAATHLYKRVFGYPMLQQELSVLIREGALDREQARARLAREPWVDEVPARGLFLLGVMCGLPPAHLLTLAKQAARRIGALRLGLRAFYSLFPRPALPLPDAP